jgi:hypothetical protein
MRYTMRDQQSARRSPQRDGTEEHPHDAVDGRERARVCVGARGHPHCSLSEFHGDIGSALGDGQSSARRLGSLTSVSACPV